MRTTAIPAAAEETEEIKTKTPVKRSKLKKYLNDNKYVYAMMLPVIVWFGIFCYWPITWIRMAFYDYSLTNGFKGSTFVLFNNFLDFFEGEFFHLLGNTLAINLLALVFLFPASIILALAFNEVRCKAYKKTLSIISYLPHFLSTAALVGFISSFLDPDSGLAGQLCKLLNITYRNSLLYKAEAFRGIQVISGIWQTVGWNSIIYSAALTSIDPCLYEAAEIDGCTPSQIFWKITMPLIRPILVYVMITSLIGGLQMFDVPQILTNGKGNPDRCATTMIMYLNNHMFSKNYGMAGAVSVILFIICAVLCVVIYRSTNEDEGRKKK